ncbi:MAG: RHS repeat protein, partial [Parcubacteria group bacterium]|nr:RHS repeat protein [Parcubacteria group bacterium]
MFPQITTMRSPASTLQSLPMKDRANRKGETIAALGAIEKTQRENYSIEITEMNPIEGGVEVFARAWNKNGDPIGFGTDGTVEMERFRIFNPPILVPDQNGEVSRFDSETRQIFKLREDPKEAILQTLEHNLSVMKNIHTGEKIVKGKVGRTTDTYYPDANPESVSVDGYARHAQNLTWTNIHDAAGTETDDVSNPNKIGGIDARGAGTTDHWNVLYRFYSLFDTSPLPDTDNIVSATLSIKGTSKSNDFTTNSFTWNVYSGTPASNTAIAPTDYAQSHFGTTALSDAISYTNWSTSAFNNWSLNASGIANVSKTGVSKFGIREATYDVPNVAPTWQDGKVVEIFGNNAEEAGSTNDPKLVIEHTPTPTASGFLTNGLINPLNIATTTLYFSAIHQNASSTALATSYEIQIATSTGFTSFYWDSGKQTLSSSTPPNQRTPNIYATTTFPIDGTAYSWRIKFWDQYDIALDYSTTTASFTMRAPATVLQDLNYTYDANGNITQISDASGGNGAGNYTYAYDSLYRLTRASSTDAVSNWLQTYAYDNLGNLTNKSDVGDYTYANTGYANPHAATEIVMASAGSGVTSTSTPALVATSTSITTGLNPGPVTKTWTHTVSGTNPLIVLTADI